MTSLFYIVSLPIPGAVRRDTPQPQRDAIEPCAACDGTGRPLGFEDDTYCPSCGGRGRRVITRAPAYCI